MGAMMRKLADFLLPRGLMLLSPTVAMACGEDGPARYDVDPPCAASDELSDLLCGSPVVVVAAASTRDHVRQLAGDAYGRLYVVERGDDGAEPTVVESRSVNESFGPLWPVLTCDVDGNGIDEILVMKEGESAGTILWDGRLWNEEERRAIRIPSDELWRIGCGDLDGDGAADLWGFSTIGRDLQIHRGSLQGFDDRPTLVSLGRSLTGPLMTAAITRRPGCGGSAMMAVAEIGATSVTLVDLDVGAQQAAGLGSLSLAAKLRNVYIQARGEGAAVVLAQLIDTEADNQPLVSIFESAACDEPFLEVATISFSRVRRVNPASRGDEAVAEWVIVGDETDGVQLIAIEDGSAEVVRRWDIAAIDAMVVGSVDDQPTLLAAVADAPYLRWEAP
jgi:hypothetical protein